ncbi:MAG TPA: IPT/TIG domain-containing protein [Niastella sp.]
MKPISICPKLSAYNAIVRKSILSILLILFANLVFAQPTISSFSPVSGPPGTVMTITGTGFNTTAASNIVFFGPVKGTVTAATATSLTVIVPANAGYQPFTVTANNLTAFSAKPFTLYKPGMDPLDAYTLSSTKGAGYVTWDNSKNAMAPIDLNADGKPELVATQEWVNTINLFTNTSGSTNIGFTTTIPYDIGEWAKDIIAGDLNSDGIPEVVVAKENSNSISIYNNSLANIYNASVTYGPNSLAIADFDGDGKPDIAVGCDRSANVTILRNTSTGATLSFSKQVITMSSTVRKLAVRDMDGDGKPDIAGILPDNNSIGIMLNTYTSGNLTFTTTTFAGNAGAIHIQVSDLDGDDKPDIAISNATTKTLSIFRNTSTVSNISLDAKIDYPANGTPTALAIGDIDGDTKPEIALGDGDNAIVQVFKNNSTTGAIGFTSTNFATGMSASSVLVNDFNGDGKNDVAITSVTANSIQVLRNVSNEPDITSFTPTEGDGTTTITITGRNLTNAGSVTFGGISAASFIVNSSTSITAIPASTGADGSISVTTPFGTAYSSGIFNFLTPPTITSYTPNYGTKGGTVTINGTNFRNVSEVTIGGVKATIQFINVSGTSMQVTIGAGATGDVVVKTSDGTATKAGFTYYDKPAITSFTPTSGHNGDTIVITGNNFNGLQQVVFGGYVSIYRIAESNTTIKAVVGTGATGDVTVKTLGGQVSLAGFTWLPPAPIITSFTPTSGVSGTLITITGDNFTGVTDVKFGGITAPYTIVNSTTITATLTSGATGDVSVTGPGGTGTLGGFTFIYPVPTITSISPASATEGEAVTITGTNFTNTANVSFGGTAATSFTVVSPTEITAIVGKGSSGNVSVTTPVGTANITGFTYVLPKPTIVGFAPQKAAKGNTLTITGTNFTNASIVSLGGTPVASYTVVSSTIINAIVGEGSSGDVLVTTPAGTANMPGFTFIEPEPQNPVVNEPMPTELIIYPNPAQSRTSFWVKHPVFTNDTWIRVVDMSGRVIVIVKVPAGTHTTEVTTPMLKSGYYKVGMHGALLYQYKTLMIR